MKRANKKHEPLYFSVREVCKLLHLKPHILDYWEKRFPEIKPYKIAKRNFYKKEQIDLLSQIKKLLEEGYTLEGARKKIFSSEGSSKGATEVPITFSKIKPNLRTNLKKIVYPAKGEEKLKRLLEEVLQELKEIYNSL